MFNDLTLSFIPNRIAIVFNILLSDYCVVYDDTSINEIIEYNLSQKYNPGEIITPPWEDPGDVIPDPDTSVPGDGDVLPDNEGYFDYYERCTEATPKALLVVEDEIDDGDYDVGTMIRISRVIKDIPDIAVGEYVIYREAIQYTD